MREKRRACNRLPGLRQQRAADKVRRMSALPWWHPDTLARRRPALDARRAAVKGVRAYFQAEGFLDVETPALQVSPGIERHIRSFATRLHGPLDEPGAERFLHTSPEFAMKKLLAGGLEKIVQICPVYRDGERSAVHHPAFTMIEWYRAHADYTAVMEDSVRVMRAVAKAAHRALETDGLLRWRDSTCDPEAAPERLTVQEAFYRHAGIDLLATVDDPESPLPPAAPLAAAARSQGVAVRATDTWEDVFFRVMLDRIEPHLGHGRLTILCDYPAALAALARRKPADRRVAERFELYACGVELANAFSELTDAVEQRARFLHDQAMHERLYGRAPPLDEDFLAALPFLPPCAGAALGFDRALMLAVGAADITEVLWAPVS
jgi:lysyl-tRNA synthetase class 2